MADELMPQTDPMASPEAPAPAPAPDEAKGFLSTPAGRIVLAAVGLVVLLAIAGVVVIFLFNPFGGASNDPTVLPPIKPNSAAKSAESTAPTDPPEPVGTADVFTFRDVFAPTVKPAVIPTPTTDPAATDSGGTTVSSGSDSSGSSGSDSSGSTDSGSGSDSGSSTKGTAGDDTLYLNEVVSQDGKQVAVLSYNGTEYRLAAGERVADTPWKVLEVNSSSVVMLYGDSQVTLSVGQGMTK